MKNKTIEQSKYNVEVTDTDLLNKGAYGKVYKKVHNDLVYVVKKPNSEKGGKPLLTELTMQPPTRHINIVALYGGEHKNFFQESYLIFEYANAGDLCDYYVTKSYGLPPNAPVSKTNISILLGVIEGLEHIHQNNIIHRDIKPENIVLHSDENGVLTPKICDFGLAKKIESPNKYVTSSGLSGTFYYSAPESILSFQYSTKSDMFAFGGLCYMSQTTRVHFQDDDRSTVCGKISQGVREEIPSYVNKDMATFITKCMHQNPTVRPSTSEAAGFFRDNFLNSESNEVGQTKQSCPPKITPQIAYSMFSDSSNEQMIEEEAIFEMDINEADDGSPNGYYNK